MEASGDPSHVTRAAGLLFLLVAACTFDSGSGVERPVPAPDTRMATVRLPPDPKPEPRRPLDVSRIAGADAPSVVTADDRTTTSTVAWASVRLEDEQPAKVAVPVRIEIMAIDLGAPIRPLGVVRETGQMEVPENVNEVGWYRFGPAPGGPGSAVLAAHVDMAGEGPGVFFDLDRLRVGDLINVAFDDGMTSSFVVLQAERVAKGELNFDAVFSPVGEPLLRLIT